MRKLTIFIISFIIVLLGTTHTAYGKEDPPTVSADSVVLMDAETGELLYSKNPDSAYPPASTTKLMTALLTLERLSLDDTVKIGKNPPLVEGSKIYLFEGEEIKVRDLLYGLLLVSGNDCAEALAEKISGSVDSFAVEMNKRALELGAKNTNFINPSGLFNEEHKTSAKDLALIMGELSKNPEYSKIATASFYNIPPTNKSSSERPLWNENKLIQKSSTYYYEGCQGGKTGYTVQSQHSYVSVASRNGQKLIVALVHDSKKTFFPDAISLFNYGFNNFTLTQLFKKGDLITNYSYEDSTIPLLAASDFYYIKEKDSGKVPKCTLNDSKLEEKYFSKGEVIADAEVTYNNKSIGTLKLMSGSDHQVRQVFQSNVFNNKYLKAKYILPNSVILVIFLLFSLRKLNSRR